MKPVGLWPTVNQRVEVHTPAFDAWLSSRIEDREDRRLVLAAPFDTSGRLLVAQPGDPVALRWVEQRGLGRLGTTVTGELGGRVALWELWADEVPTLHQRRRFARVPVMLPVSVAGASGEKRLLSLDLSEGGVLCAASLRVAFGPEERVKLTFEVDGRRLEAEARVVWSRAARGGGSTVAFRFVALPRHDADHLRRFVYARQVHLAATGRL
jgi:c-di-GMP-binding flagellar brake protein YcgR